MRKKLILAGFLLAMAVFGFAQTNRFYVGARFGASQNFYSPFQNIDIGDSVGFNGAMQFAVQIFEHWALQTEFMFAQDAGMVYDVNNTSIVQLEFFNNSLMIPILSKATFRPGNFSIAAFGGVYFPITLGGVAVRTGWGGSYYYPSYNVKGGGGNVKNAIGFMAGGSFGINAGPGTVFIDVRYAGDFWGTRIFDNYYFRRGKLPITIGYEIGFIGMGSSSSGASSSSSSGDSGGSGSGGRRR